MKRVAAGLALAIIGLSGGTMAYVYRQAELTHRLAVARCLDAGGAWLPRSTRSFSGTCLSHPGPQP